MARTELPNGIILPAEYSDDWYDDMTSNLSKLDEVIGSDADKLSAEDVGAAALSNDYTDLDNKPALKPVATSGDYDDLTDLPAYGITRFCSSAITDNSSVAFSAISSTDKIKVGDFLLDTVGKMYQISAVDTSNETVSVTTPLTQLAVDANVMHLSGDETATGSKTFRDTLIIYNPDNTAYATYLNLKNQRNVRGSTTDIGTQGLQYQDKNNRTLTMLESRVVSNGNTSFNIICYNIDGNNQVVSDGVSVIKTSSDTNFAPTTNNAVTCGRTLAKWSDVQTYKVNNLTPSSLSLPSDRSARVDISGYFTNTANGDTNTYTVPANGWIYLNLNDVVVAHCFAQTASNLSHYGQTFARASAGQLHCLFPVRKDDVFVSQWYTTTTVTVTNAYFIPCQGNV